MNGPPSVAPPDAYGRRHRLRWSGRGQWRMIPAGHLVREAVVPLVLSVGLVAWSILWLAHGDVRWGWSPLLFAVLGFGLARKHLDGAWGSYARSDGSVVVRARPHASADTEDDRVFQRKEILHFQTRQAESGADDLADLIVEVGGYHGPWRYVLDRDWPRTEAELAVAELERGLGHFSR